MPMYPVVLCAIHHETVWRSCGKEPVCVLQTKQRSITLPTFINSAEGIAAAARQLLHPELPITVRLLGVRVSTLQPASHALPGSLESFLRKGLKSSNLSTTAGNGQPQDGDTTTCDEAAHSEPCRPDMARHGSGRGMCAQARREDIPGPVECEPDSDPTINVGVRAAPGFHVCPECGVHVATGSMREHSDMHVAQRLSATVNGAGYIEAKSANRSLDSVDKGQGAQQRPGSKRGQAPQSKKKKVARPCKPGALDRLLKK